MNPHSTATDLTFNRRRLLGSAAAASGPCAMARTASIIGSGRCSGAPMAQARPMVNGIGLRMLLATGE